MLVATITSNSVTVTGHALFAPKGEDLVCAAVSGIVLGTKDIFAKRGFSIDKKNASVTLSAKKGETYQQAALQVVTAQLSAVAQSYPEHVRIIRE